MSVERYDVVVIGGGPAGENAADYAIRGSDRTAALVEGGLLGGECSYYACMPSKALLRPLDVAEAARHLPGIRPPVELDRDALLARRDDWVSHYDDAGQVSWAEGASISVVRGHGRLAGERRVEVTETDGASRTLEATHAVVLATGSVPVVPAAFADAAPWTSADATGVVEVPDRLVVVGGGVVACEAARWMAALGSRVTMLVRGPRLLAGAEPFAGELVAARLLHEGVDVRLGAAVDSVARDSPRDAELGHLHGGTAHVTTDDGDVVEADEILLATGRRPATDGLGLDSVGLRPDDLTGSVQTDRMPTWLSTVGDLNGQAPLTHWGKHQARGVGRAIAARAEGRTPPQAPDAPVPQVVFSDPQVAWVGETRAAAEERGADVRVLDADVAAVAGAALLRDDAVGRARLVVEGSTGRLLGATFVGPEVAELLHSATVAIAGGLDVDTLAQAVPSYPTASEVWLRLLDQW